MKPSFLNRHDLSCRSLQPELMDAPVASPESYDDIMRQIERVNALTGGYRPVLAWLKKRLALLERQRSFTIIDVGCGRGDLLREIEKRFWGWKIKLVGLDINPLAIKAARGATEKTSVEYHLADVFASDDLLAADLIICSHMTHHMTDEEIIKLMRLMERKAKLGWFICDLHRHRMAYLSVRGILAVLPVDPMVAHDGPLSVRRAFKRREWQKLIYEAALPFPVQVRWHFPFRYGLSSRNDLHEKI